MYTINYRLCGYCDNQIEETFSAKDAQDAANQILIISNACPVTRIQFEEGKWIDPKLHYYYPPSEDRRKWRLDYTVPELTEMIHRAIKNGGIIKIWHDPYFGKRL